MPHHKGLRGGTRNKFRKQFKTRGMPNLTRYLTTFKRGDYVDILVDPSIQKGMPYHYYHGRTGRVFNVAAHGVGVEIKKRVKGRIMIKRICIRREHVRKSRCREAYLTRKADLEAQRLADPSAKISTKRIPPGQPRPSKIVARADAPIIELKPLRFDAKFV